MPELAWTCFSEHHEELGHAELDRADNGHHLASRAWTRRTLAEAERKA